MNAQEAEKKAPFRARLTIDYCENRMVEMQDFSGGYAMVTPAPEAPNSSEIRVEILDEFRATPAPFSML